MKEPYEEAIDKNPQLLYERRIFVGGLSKECNEKLLFESFSKYGKIQDLEFVQHKQNEQGKRKDMNLKRKRERPSFAFITFESRDSASNAIKLSQESSSTSPHYSLVREAVPPKRQNQTKYKAKLEHRHEQERKRYLAIEQSCEKCNVILQAHTSHLDRLVDYLPTLKSSALEIQVTGTVSTGSDNISLVMVNSNHPVQLTEKLWSDNPILDRMALNKSYVVTPESKKLQKRQDIDDSRPVLQDLLISSIQELQKELLEMDNYSPSKPVVLKIQAFPPKLLQKIAVSTVDKILNGFEENNWRDTRGVEWAMSPKLEECTHMISCVMLHEGLESVDKSNSALYMIGHSPISYEGLAVNRSMGKKDEVSRAYYKLKEAFERYGMDSSVSLNFEGKVAFDCGSAPGGWTRFLIQDLKCAKVYSCDPGELSVKIKQLKGVKHLQMKSDMAIDSVQTEQKNSEEMIHIWVSDMCLSDLEDQVSTLFQAKESNILAPDAFFVLTLKCTTGHSRGTFDALTQKEISRLLENLESPKHVRSYHLFSNRRGERTVMGFVG